MCKCKTEAIQTDLGTFRHNQAYPGIIQAYSGIFKTMCNPGILRNVALSEPWYIQNPPPYSQPPYIQNASIFKIRGIFRILANIWGD